MKSKCSPFSFTFVLPSFLAQCLAHYKDVINKHSLKVGTRADVEDIGAKETGDQTARGSLGTPHTQGAQLTQLAHQVLQGGGTVYNSSKIKNNICGETQLWG